VFNKKKLIIVGLSL